MKIFGVNLLRLAYLAKGNEGEGGQKVPALISNFCNIQAIVAKLCDFS